jgi:hypothetical protein
MLDNLMLIKKERNYLVEKYKSSMIVTDNDNKDNSTFEEEPNKNLKEFQVLKEEYRIKLSYLHR